MACLRVAHGQVGHQTPNDHEEEGGSSIVPIAPIFHGICKVVCVSGSSADMMGDSQQFLCVFRWRGCFAGAFELG